MKKNDRNKLYATLSGAGAFVTFALFLLFVTASQEEKTNSFWGSVVSGLMFLILVSLAVDYTKAMRKTERILIEDTSVYEEEELLACILLLPQNNLPIYEAFRKRVIDSMVQRIIRNPNCLKTASKVKFLLSQEGTIWSSQILVILEGIRVEELTLEQIIKLLKRSDSIIVPNLFSRLSKFRTALLQELLRKEKDGKGELTAEDLTVLEKLKNGFIGSDLQCLELRLELIDMRLLCYSIKVAYVYFFLLTTQLR